MLPTPNALSEINFSADSELVILETDAFNPLLVVNLTSNTALHSVTVNDTILRAHFLNSSNQQLVVHCQNSLRLVDLPTGSQYLLPAISPDSYATDSDSHIFTCQNGASSLLEQKKLTFTRVPIPVVPTI
jgi:hypothetical protein